MKFQPGDIISNGSSAMGYIMYITYRGYDCLVITSGNYCFIPFNEEYIYKLKTSIFREE